MEAAALRSRPGVRRCGWLSKEGANALSRAFPSRRFCVLLDTTLEYYEEREISCLPPAESDGAGPSLGFDTNDWNLVVHVHLGAPAGARGGLLVGDIVIAVDGVALEGRLLHDVVSGTVARRGAASRLSLLRPKGEVPLAGAAVTQIGQDRLRVAPSPSELLDPRRGPYVFIAPGYSERDDWFWDIQQRAAGAAEPAGEGG